MIFEGPAKKFIVPALQATMPPDYKKWAAPLVQYSVKSFSISLAWFIQRVISAVHAALRGSKMCAENLLDYLTTMGFLSAGLRANLRLDLILAPGSQHHIYLLPSEHLLTSLQLLMTSVVSHTQRHTQRSIPSHGDNCRANQALVALFICTSVTPLCSDPCLLLHRSMVATSAHHS